MNTYVSFKTAKLLKEKGFQVPTRKNYQLALTSQKDSETGDYTGSFGWKEGELNLCGDYFINNHPSIDFSSKNWYMCSAPSISEVVMWLLEEHQVWIYVKQGYKWEWYIETVGNNPGLIERDGLLDSPSDAYEDGIKYTLNNLV
jgi:hypothetical protein